MRNMAAVSSDESTILIICTLEWSPTQFVLQCDQWFHDGLKSLSLFIIFRAIFGWALYPSPFLFLFALHLDWSVNTSIDEKIKSSLHIPELVFFFSSWFKLSIFISLVLFSLEMHNRSGKKVIGKKLRVDKQFFKNVIWIFWCYSL